MRSALSYAQMPPVSVPMRFLLSAPWFGAAAALLLAARPESLLASRWSAEALAATHLLTLGFLGLCMIGALTQILPVVLGIVLPQPLRLGRWVHPALAGGALSLSAAFLFEAPWLFRIAMAMLAGGFGAFLIATLTGCRRGERATVGVSAAAIRLALIGLLMTVMLGLVLASAFAGLVQHVPLLLLTEMHVAWGSAGWIGLLVAGVGFQVIPMFQATPVYPQRLAGWLPPAVFALLCLGSLRFWLPAPVAHLSDGLLAMLLSGFALFTLALLAQRKRPHPDNTTRYWWLALTSLIGAALAWMLAEAEKGSALLTGCLFLAGFAVSAVNGMLYKIVPFLAWYHLQEGFDFSQGSKPPSLKEFLSDQSARWQFRVHALAVLMLASAAAIEGTPPWAVAMARVAGLALAASFVWLGLNLTRSWRLYRALAVQPS